jgi:hypothetical protein
MDIGSVFVIAGIFLLAGLFVVRPFFERDRRGEDRVRHRYSHLVAEKERLLEAIQELDLDLELKKITPEDHARKRSQLTAEAARILKELDQLQSTDPGLPKAQPGAGDEVDELEALISSRRKELHGSPEAFCPHCGKKVQEEDQYCTHCGEKIP